MRERYRATFDSAMDNCFHVHKENGKLSKFKEATRRLYYFDTVERDEEHNVLITTVEDNKSKLILIRTTKLIWSPVRFPDDEILVETKFLPRVKKGASVRRKHQRSCHVL